MTLLREGPGAARAVRLPGAGVSMRVRPRQVVVCALLVVAALGMAAYALTTGDFPIPLPEALRALVGSGDGGAVYVVTELRLPRVITALLVGLALGLSGAVFQSLVRNPLASPEIIGLDAGAATGAILAIVALRSADLPVSAAAITGALVAAVIVYVLSWRRGVSGYRLVLVGVGVTAVLEAFNAYLLKRGETLATQEALRWLFGSLNGRTWDDVTAVVIGVAILVPVLALLARRLLLLELGDDAATALGVPVEGSRLALVVVATALVGLTVAVTGPIAFVALSAPQIARRLTRGTGPQLLPAGLTGAFLLITADLIAQRMFGDRLLPVGVATTLFGGAYLLWLLSREWRAGHG